MTVTFFVTSWCPDCVRSRRVLQRLGVTFDEVDIEQDRDAEARMRALNGDSGKIPTIVIATETESHVLIEPSNRELTDLICSLTE